jgi:hypothetical protein
VVLAVELQGLGLREDGRCEACTCGLCQTVAQKILLIGTDTSHRARKSKERTGSVATHVVHSHIALQHTHNSQVGAHDKELTSVRDELSPTVPALKHSIRTHIDSILRWGRAVSTMLFFFSRGCVRS